MRGWAIGDTMSATQEPTEGDVDFNYVKFMRDNFGGPKAVAEKLPAEYSAANVQKWFERGSIPTIPFIYLLIQSRAGLRDVLNEYWEFD